MNEPLRILLSNVGYARGINGTLAAHLLHAHRHVWCPPGVQCDVMGALKGIIRHTNPDLCCLLEVDTGSANSAGINQLTYLQDADYPFIHAENKYQVGSRRQRAYFSRGKSHALMGKRAFPYTLHYFSHGTKRLIYRVDLDERTHLLFTHFSLYAKVRQRQFAEIATLAERTDGEVMVLGDFNVLTGLHEITPLLNSSNLVLMNDESIPTFLFHRRNLTLDLCLCSPGLAQRTQVHIIPQPFSDHEALLAEVQLSE